MNGGSISRKPIRDAQLTAAPQQHFVSATQPGTSVPPPSMYPATQQVAPFYATMQPATLPNHMYGLAHAPSQNAGIQQYQSPVMSLPTSPQQAMPMQASPTQAVQHYHTVPIMNTQQPSAMSPLAMVNTPSQTNFSHLQSPTSPTPGPGPGWLTRADTANSVVSSPSNHSQTPSEASSFMPGTPATTVSIPETPPQNTIAAAPSIGACTSCKQAIAQNVSIFTCLVCSTASVTTHVCVWCYTTGAAASAHIHDMTFLATDSDLHAPDTTGKIPASTWTIRKNASGRLWFTHNQTGFRTHIRPLTAVGEDLAATTSLPLGWQEFKTHDGKLYYFQASTGTSFWERPKNPLPSGWKMVKTPDGVPFYVHDGFQLATWGRPGEQPKLIPVNPPAATAAIAPGNVIANTAVTAPGATIATTVPRPGRKGKTAANVATVAAVANNVAKLSAASDLSPSGILTATVAAAKLTGIGVKLAGKKMGRMGKMKHLNTATNVLGVAARLTGDGDDDDGGDVEEEDETVETDVTCETVETTTVVEEYPGDGDGNGATGGFPEQPPDQASYAVAGDQTFPGQQQGYFPQTQPVYLCDPPMAATTPVTWQQPLEPFPQQAPVVVNNINVTVEETSVNDINVQNTAYTDATVFAPIITQPVQEGATITDLSWAMPPAIYGPPDAAAGFGPQVAPLIEPLPPVGGVILSEGGAPPSPLVPPPQIECLTINTGPSDAGGGEALPFVFSPILAAPLAVPSPAAL